MFWCLGRIFVGPKSRSWVLGWRVFNVLNATFNQFSLGPGFQFWYENMSSATRSPLHHFCLRIVGEHPYQTSRHNKNWNASKKSCLTNPWHFIRKMTRGINENKTKYIRFIKIYKSFWVRCWDYSNLLLTCWVPNQLQIGKEKSSILLLRRLSATTMGLESAVIFLRRSPTQVDPLWTPEFRISDVVSLSSDSNRSWFLVEDVTISLIRLWDGISVLPIS